MTITWNIGTEVPITPTDEMPPFPEVTFCDLFVITGRAPIWRYGVAIAEAIEKLDMRVAIATFDPRIGNVVVRGGIDYKKGHVIE